MNKTQSGGSVGTDGQSSGSGGVFDNLSIPATEPSEAIENQQGQEGQEGQESGTEVGQPADAEGGESKGGEPALDKPTRLLAGQFKSAEDLEKAYSHSSREGYKLFKEVRDMQSQLKDRDSRIAELEEEIKLVKSEGASFQELTPEQLQQLATENPLKAAEYVAEKKLRERDAKSAKDQTKREREEKDRLARQVREHIDRRTDEMSSDQVKYPDYISLQPVMEEILDKTQDAVAGFPWTPDLLYFAAYGIKSLRSRGQAADAATRARNVARARADADADLAGSTGGTGSSTPRGKGPDDDSDEAFNKRLVKAGPQPIFKLT